MLRFFRTIRKKLIEQDNVRKYFIYATGEILLVVIGILIALQVNNWNEARVDQERGLAYRSRIISDLETDIVELEKRKAFWSAAAEGRIALAYAEEGRLPEEGSWGVLRALLHASQVWRFIFNQTNYLEMRSTGDLRLIDDSQLRSDLAYYYVTVAERRGDGMYQSLPQYRETVRSLVPSRISQYYWQACHEQPPGEQSLKSCPSPMEDAEAAAALEAVIGHADLVSGLRFWVDTLEVLDRLVDDDIQIARNLIDQLTEGAL